MKEEIKQKWIDALRSGEYQQGRYRLRTGDCYCCLGVLCDIYIKETGKASWKAINKTKYPIEYVFKGGLITKIVSLPSKVKRWSGFSFTSDDTINLMYKNDILKESFLKIAAIIEKHL